MHRYMHHQHRGLLQNRKNLWLLCFFAIILANRLFLSDAHSFKDSFEQLNRKILRLLHFDSTILKCMLFQNNNQNQKALNQLLFTILIRLLQTDSFLVRYELFLNENQVIKNPAQQPYHMKSKHLCVFFVFLMHQPFLNIFLVYCCSFIWQHHNQLNIHQIYSNVIKHLLFQLRIHIHQGLFKQLY